MILLSLGHKQSSRQMGTLWADGSKVGNGSHSVAKVLQELFASQPAAIHWKQLWLHLRAPKVTPRVHQCDRCFP